MCVVDGSSKQWAKHILYTCSTHFPHVKDMKCQRCGMIVPTGMELEEKAGMDEIELFHNLIFKFCRGYMPGLTSSNSVENEDNFLGRAVEDVLGKYSYAEVSVTPAFERERKRMGSIWEGYKILKAYRLAGDPSSDTVCPVRVLFYKDPSGKLIYSISSNAKW